MTTRGHAPLHDRRPYFVRNGTGTRPPLYFLHGDFDGGGLYCLGLADRLGRDQPLWMLSPHGMRGERLPRSIQAMARAHLETLRRLAPHGPYRLGGHCNGGLIAYEMARQLSAAGELVDRVVLIAARARNRHVIRKMIRDSPVAHYAQRIGALATMSGAVRRATMARALHQLTPWGDAATPTPRHSGSSRMLQAYRLRMALYRPGAFAGSVMLLWPEEEPAEPGDDATLGWGRGAPAVRVVRIPGGHHSCLTTHVAALAATLRGWLDGP